MRLMAVCLRMRGLPVFALKSYAWSTSLDFLMIPNLARFVLLVAAMRYSSKPGLSNLTDLFFCKKMLFFINASFAISLASIASSLVNSEPKIFWLSLTEIYTFTLLLSPYSTSSSMDPLDFLALSMTTGQTGMCFHLLEASLLILLSYISSSVGDLRAFSTRSFTF